MNKQSFVLIGSGAILSSAIKKIIEFNGIIKAIYVDNETDRKRYINSFKIKKTSKVNDDYDFLKGIVNQSTWLLSIENKKIIAAEILSIFKGRALNFHPGILPHYKGLYCYQWAVLNGEKNFAATIHIIEPEIDVGDVVIEKTFPINEEDTGLSIYQKSIKFGKEALNDVLKRIFSRIELPKVPKKNSSKKIYGRACPFEIEIDWEKSADQILQYLKASNFYPLAPPAFQICYLGAPVWKGNKLTKTTSKKAGTVIYSNKKRIEIATCDKKVVEIFLLPNN